MRSPSSLSIHSDAGSASSDHTVRAVCGADTNAVSSCPSTAASAHDVDLASSLPPTSTDTHDLTITVESASTCVASTDQSLAIGGSRPASQLSAFIVNDLSKFKGLFYNSDDPDDPEPPLLRPLRPCRVASEVHCLIAFCCDILTLS